jgi:hypothetical protein
VQKEWVFPALLTNTTDLKAAVDEHLTKLVDNPANFSRFPLYQSPLVVLKHIYEFYLKLGEVDEEVKHPMKFNVAETVELTRIRNKRRSCLGRPSSFLI